MAIHSKQLTHPTYRPDIDGLRAIAVLPVVLFHAFPGLIAGGFIGVDIFFVISGFLISGIIFSNLERNSFSLGEFYYRRVKRIIPALLVVLIFCFVSGWFVLLADEYRELCKQIIGGVSFLSNYILWRESGYFDTAAGLKPLLHLWSLAVEEQFYIFWPLLLAFVWKRKWSFVAITATIAAISFAINMRTTGTDPSAAFFLPVPRFWELMTGSLLAYIVLHKPHWNSRHQNMQSTLGAVLLVLGMAFINRERAFPGWWALLPALGAALIISAGPKAWLNSHVLANKVLVWFGLISYPLYLWHWPLLSFATIQEGETPSLLMRICAVMISVALAWLTFRYIEKPIRFGGHGGAKIAVMVFLMFVIGVASYLGFKKNGFEGMGGFGRISQAEQNQFLDYFNNRQPEMHYFTALHIPEKWHFECDFYNQEAARLGHATIVPVPKIDPSCYTRDKAHDHAVLIWGDSHSQHLSFGLRNNLPGNWQLLQTSSSGCVPDPDFAEPSTTDYCKQSNWFALKTMAAAKPDVVVVSENLGQSVGKFSEIAKKLTGLGVKKIIFAGPTPHWTADLPRIVVRRLWNDTPRRTFVGIDKQVLEDNSTLQNSFQNSGSQVFANIIGLFCNQSGCMTYLGEDKKTGLTSFDKGHLTPVASDYLAKNLLVPLIVDSQADHGPH